VSAADHPHRGGPKRQRHPRPEGTGPSVRAGSAPDRRTMDNSGQEWSPNVSQIRRLLHLQLPDLGRRRQGQWSSSLPTSTSKAWCGQTLCAVQGRPTRSRYRWDQGCLGVQPVQTGGTSLVGDACSVITSLTSQGWRWTGGQERGRGGRVP
jgi:hypothetical protein